MLLLNIYENWFREKEQNYSRSEQDKLDSNISWHIIQFFGWAVIFITTDFLICGLNITGFKILFLFASIWWILFDGGLNLLRHLPFFRVSKVSGNPIEKYGTPAVKIILLTSAAIWMCL